MVLILNGFCHWAFAQGPVRVRAVDIQTLRSLINQKKTLCGLPAQVWTDDPVHVGMPIKKLHIDEMRVAVNASYAAKSQPPPGYTDEPIIAKETPIKAVHLLELTTINAALSCASVTMSCADLMPHPLIQPAGWGTLAMPMSGAITGTFVSPVSGPITIPIVVSVQRETQGVCAPVAVTVRDSGGIPVGGNSYPIPIWPGYAARCISVGGSGYSNHVQNIVFNAIMGATYTVDFGFRKVTTPGPNRNAWSWTSCRP